MTQVLFADMPDASPWRRLAAAVYDGLLLLAAWFSLTGLLVLLNHNQAVPPATMQWIGLPLLFAIATAFYGWFWLHGGQTLGMRAWRLRLVTVDRRPLRFRDCVVRCVVGLLSLACGLLGWLWVLVDREHRAWHDRASRTRVVRLPKDAT